MLQSRIVGPTEVKSDFAFQENPAVCGAGDGHLISDGYMGPVDGQTRRDLAIPMAVTRLSKSGDRTAQAAGSLKGI